MRNVIILKGERSTGKSETLRSYLPPKLGYWSGKLILNYNDKRILIIRRSIHESPDWKSVIKKIIKYKDHIIVVAAWLDEIVKESKCIKRKLEEVLSSQSSDAYNFHEVFTSYQKSLTSQKQDHERCSSEIKKIIDSL